MRAPGADYEDGAPVPKPLALPVEADDTSFLVDRCIDYISGARGRSSHTCRSCGPHPPFIAPEPYNAMYDPLDVPGFMRRATPDDEAASIPGSRINYRAARSARLPTRRSCAG